MEYLRWQDDGTPAAGSFDGWPESLKEFTMLDPCCGSGHFLVAAFRLLVPLRMHDEGLSARDACDAVLRENLFGLEIDPRCTQIAAFALALTAWTYPGPDGEPLGYRPLPTLNIACSGQGVVGSKEDWAKFAGDDRRFREGMERLYDLFQSAPHLGSLINPHTVTEDLFALGFDTLKGTVERALKKIEARDDPDKVALGVAAQGIAVAASLMAREFTLVATNVPYLGRGKQHDVMKEYLERFLPEGKADLSTAFILRCLDFCRPGGSTALVTPQNWLLLSGYSKLRGKLLNERTWNGLALLGEEAWWTFGMRGPRTLLLIMTETQTDATNRFFGIDVSTNRGRTPILLDEKAARLANRQPTPMQVLQQAHQLQNPDARIVFEHSSGELLKAYADSRYGLRTGDSERFILKLWELDTVGNHWVFHQSYVPTVIEWGGRENVLKMGEQCGRFSRIFR